MHKFAYKKQELDNSTDSKVQEVQKRLEFVSNIKFCFIRKFTSGSKDDHPVVVAEFWHVCLSRREVWQSLNCINLSPSALHQNSWSVQWNLCRIFLRGREHYIIHVNSIIWKTCVWVIVYFISFNPFFCGKGLVTWIVFIHYTNHSSLSRIVLIIKDQNFSYLPSPLHLSVTVKSCNY